jgi:Uma2 family endonuclease
MTADALPRSAPMTAEEFLAFLDARPAEERWELRDGRPVALPRAMVGGTLRHSLIAGNVVAALRFMARTRGCQAHGGDLMVVPPDHDGFGVFPDAFVRCGPSSDEMRKADDPFVVVEVLSPSTAAHDRGDKFLLYASIPTVSEILLVYQHKIAVERWVRGAEGFELDDVTGADAILRIDALGGTITLAEIYAGTALSPQPR